MLDIDIIGTLGSVLKGKSRGRRIVGTLLRSFVDEVAVVVEQALSGDLDGESFMRAEEAVFRTSAALGGRIMAGVVAAVHQDQDWLRTTAERSREKLAGSDRQKRVGMRETVVSFLGGVRVQLLVLVIFDRDPLGIAVSPGRADMAGAPGLAASGLGT
jgi:hypothetical protein